MSRIPSIVIPAKAGNQGCRARRSRLRVPVFAGMMAWLAAIAAPSALAQGVVTSSGPEKVSVTIYRQPDRSADDRIDLRWLGGYALVTETRTVTIPQGRAVIRFEGVAGGILPESAIVTGLPDGVREKNLDADLLSPASLYAHGYGRPVTVRRTDADGVATEERAIIRSGPEGAAILETKEGVEVANCGPLRDRLVYDRVPAGLSAKPTLSVETESANPGAATITLSYLAWGFDWQANYVAELSEDGRTADLVAWVTLANGDPTSFVQADTQVVAGRIERTSERQANSWDRASSLIFQCYFESRRPKLAYAEGAVPPPPPPPPPAPMAARMMDIIVTASRVQQEDLGDLKLYRVPEPTTVAAKSQKQVALLEQKKVPVDIVYVSRVSPQDADTPVITLRARNRKEAGLGLPLPAGPVAVFQPYDGRPVLLGEEAIEDKAVGEEVEIKVAEATQVDADLEKVASAEGRHDYVLTATNANPFPVRFEAKLSLDDGQKLSKVSAKLGRRDGIALWQVQLPANGTARLRYRITTPD